LRDPNTHEPIGMLLGALDEVPDGQFWFSDDGRYMISGGKEAARLWDLELREQLGDVFPNDPNFLAGGNDGPVLVTAVGDFMMVWNLSTDEWPGIACQAAGRNLTLEEWEQFGPRDTERYAICPDYPLAD
jgi:hypothetical protein